MTKIMPAVFLLISALCGLTSVALGAFAAHGLRDRLEPVLLAAFQTGVQYQMYHALALLGLAALLRIMGPSPWLSAAGWLFVAGVVLFSGSLYALALGGPRWLGPVTPLGGLCFLLGWAALTVFAFKNFNV
ncbi:DUF423 domain-containing protein [Marinimicrobium sp. ABcell2]|uniref:DUF423 domain-containing protein n=1 Tax=Marinimicrobium sp. ABcell2 TaxID=3069751 RepID=UPI0027B1A3D3|nr:DUF423 domain-containing protein [Marinimicrobium sp. ABcell2]MDQ2076666.1 DUF423 domain-containing protein [Marinimicrobium sp. ABcell2]